MLHIVFDLETTGLPIMKNKNEYYDYKIIDKYQGSRIVQIAYKLIDNDYNILYQKDFLVKDVDIGDSERYHKIRKEDLERFGKNFNEFIDEVIEDFTNASSLIAHNINFDLNILSSELFRRGIPQQHIQTIRNKTLICTMIRLKNVINVQNSYGIKYPSMSDLYKFAFGPEAVIDNAHNAIADTNALIEALKKIKDDMNICLIKNTNQK